MCKIRAYSQWKWMLSYITSRYDRKLCRRQTAKCNSSMQLAICLTSSHAKLRELKWDHVPCPYECYDLLPSACTKRNAFKNLSNWSPLHSTLSISFTRRRFICSPFTSHPFLTSRLKLSYTSFSHFVPSVGILFLLNSSYCLLLEFILVYI